MNAWEHVFVYARILTWQYLFSYKPSAIHHAIDMRLARMRLEVISLTTSPQIEFQRTSSTIICTATQRSVIVLPLLPR